MPPADDGPDLPETGERTLATRLRHIADWIAAAMFAAVFFIFNYKIFTRYFEHNEAVWADEVLVILFIWIIFWAQAFVLRDRDQITFDLIYRLLPARARRAAATGASCAGRRRLFVGASRITRLHPVSLA